jgi:hypothetical protein
MRAAVLLVLSASACLAQLDDDIVTVTATRSVTLQPDQAMLGLNVTTPLNTGLDDVLAAMPGLGLSAADLVFVNTTLLTNNVPSLTWLFSKGVPFSNLKDAVAAATAAEQSLAANRSTFNLTFYVSSQVSQTAQQAPAVCPIPTLFADAQAQAHQIASAAGVRIGGVVSMAQGSALQLPTAALRAGDFAQAAIFDPLTGTQPSASFVSFLLTQPISPAGCSLTVQFKLLR